MVLIIFPIIISLCVLGLVFLLFKKIPQIANYSIESLLALAPNSVNLVPSKRTPKRIAVLGIFFNVVKKCYFKIKQISSRIIKGVLGSAKKIKPVVLTKKKIIDLRQSLIIRKKGDFNQLKEFFDKKKTALILPPTVLENNEVLNSTALVKSDDSDNLDKLAVSSQAPTEAEFLTERASQEHLDFKKFLNNGGKEKKPYKLEKFSFDQLFKKNRPEANQLKITEEEKKVEKKLAQEDKENTEITKFIQKEQALIQQIADEPRNAKLYAKLGELYLKVKNWQDARASFNYLLELEPQNKKARKALDKINKVLHNE